MALESQQEEEIDVGVVNGGGVSDDVDIHEDDSCDYVDEDEDEEFSFVDDGYGPGVPSSFTHMYALCVSASHTHTHRERAYRFWSRALERNSVR